MMGKNTKNKNIRAVFHISRVEFQRWMRSSRLIILGVMLVFIHMQIIVTLQDCAVRMGEPVTILEAFVALGNSGVIVLILPALFLVLFFRKEAVLIFCIKCVVPRKRGYGDRFCLHWKQLYFWWFF